MATWFGVSLDNLQTNIQRWKVHLLSIYGIPQYIVLTDCGFYLCTLTRRWSKERPKHVVTESYNYHVLLLCSGRNRLFVLLWVLKHNGMSSIKIITFDFTHTNLKVEGLPLLLNLKTRNFILIKQSDSLGGVSGHGRCPGVYYLGFKASLPSVTIKETPCIIYQVSVNRSVDQSRRLN